MRALTTGPGIVVFARCVRRRDRRRPGDAPSFDEMIADQQAPAGRRRRPLRQARRQRPRLERAGEARGARSRDLRRLLRQRRARADLRAPGSAPATRSPRRSTWSAPAAQRQDPHRDYHLGFLLQRRRRAYPTHVHLLSPVLTLQGAVAHSRHAGRERADDVPAVLAPVRRRLPRVAAAGVPRLLRRALRAAAAGQGRRGVLQPGAVPRCRHQRLDRHPTHGQPAAGLVGVRTRDGDRRPRRRPSQAIYPALVARTASGVDPTLRRQRASRRPPRATRSRPTSTGTSPSGNG